MLKAANNAYSELGQAINASVTSFSVVDGSSFPDGNFVVTIDDEIMLVGNRTGDSFSNVQRGYENTNAAAHDAGAVVENRFTAGTYTQLADAVDAHLAESAIHKTSDVIRTETETKLKVEVVSSSGSETPEQGRIIFDMSQGKFFGGNGSGWV